MDAGFGLDPNASNMSPGINTGKTVSPVKIFKFALIFSVVLSTSYGLFIDTNAVLMSCLVNQLLFVVLLIVMAIQWIKEDAKEKRVIAYIYVLVALFSLTLGIISFLEISKYWW